MTVEERIEALEQEVARLSSAVFAVEDVLGYRVSFLEEKLKDKPDQQAAAA